MQQEKIKINELILNSDLNISQNIFILENESQDQRYFQAHTLQKINEDKFGYSKNQHLILIKGQGQKIRQITVFDDKNKFLFFSYCKEVNNVQFQSQVMYYANSFFDNFSKISNFQVIYQSIKQYEQDIQVKIILDSQLKLKKKDQEILTEEINRNNEHMFLVQKQNNQQLNNTYEISLQNIQNVNLKYQLLKKINQNNLKIIAIPEKINQKIFSDDQTKYQRIHPIFKIQYKENNQILTSFDYQDNLNYNISQKDLDYIKFIEEFENELFCFVKNLLNIKKNLNILLLIKRGEDFEKIMKLIAQQKKCNIEWLDIQNKKSDELIENIKKIKDQNILIFTSIEQMFKENNTNGINCKTVKSFLKYLKKIQKEKNICSLFITSSENYENTQYEFDMVQNIRQFNSDNLKKFKEKYLSKSQLKYEDLKSIQYLFIENDISYIIKNLQPLQIICDSQKIENQKLLKLIKKKFSSSDKFETEVPKLTWDNIGGIENVKQELISSFKFDNQNEIKKQKGILLFGPPGTGKTLLAKCIANEFNSSFIAVKGPELLDKYVGESEKNLRQVFVKANRCIPCVLFFDELDSLLPKRGNSADSSSVTDRMVSQFLAELENSDPNLFLIAATNRPDLLDSAILASGKFDKKIFMGIMNSKEQRMKIIQSLTKDLNLDKNCQIQQIENICPKDITGADFYGIIMNTIQLRISKQKKLIEQKAKVKNISVKEYQKFLTDSDKKLIIQLEDFKDSLKNFTPSLSTQEIQNYELLRQQYADLEIK